MSENINFNTDMNEINLNPLNNSSTIIRLHTDHPLLIGNVATNYEKVLKYSNLKLHD